MQNNIFFTYHSQYFDNILVNQHFPNDWSHIGKDTFKVHECEKVWKVHWFSFTFHIATNQPTFKRYHLSHPDVVLRRLSTIIWKGFYNMAPFSIVMSYRFSSYTWSKITYHSRLNLETAVLLWLSLLSQMLKRFVKM